MPKHKAIRRKPQNLPTPTIQPSSAASAQSKKTLQRKTPKRLLRAACAFWGSAIPTHGNILPSSSKAKTKSFRAKERTHARHLREWLRSTRLQQRKNHRRKLKNLQRLLRDQAHKLFTHHRDIDLSNLDAEMTSGGNEQNAVTKEGAKVADETVPDPKMMLWSATHILRQKVAAWTEMCSKKDGRMEGERWKEWPFEPTDSLWVRARSWGPAGFGFGPI
ncbi:MAG: hypothetical protein Q9183_003940 [Haloplaca sp. 2 TL-2023]